MLYFAYGSNLDSKRIEERCKSAQFIATANLKDYRLVFQENNSGRVVANIIAEKGINVEGVIYHISYKDASKLDRCEGHPTVYERQEVKVEGSDIPLRVQTYIMPQVYKKHDVIKVGRKYVSAFEEVNRAYGEPKHDYLKHLTLGFEEWNLDKELLAEALEYSKELISDRTESNEEVHLYNKDQNIPVFTYGTLMKGNHNHRLLKDSQFLGEATISGFDIYDLRYGFPAVVKGAKNGKVVGEVYMVDAETLARLNQLEGYDETTNSGMYIKKKTHAIFRDGVKVYVNYYLWNRHIPAGTLKLKSGDKWRA